MKRVYIDGSAGTTGLRIAKRLQEREDIELLHIEERLRKQEHARRQMMNSADIVFFCLPDDAAREAASFVENPQTAVIDTSTAHRTDSAWVYGFPELDGRREIIKTAKRIANPGCHASGFLALIRPLTACGALKETAELTCFSLTGYTGGGKRMIEAYESPERPFGYASPRQYGLLQTHKHLPEMRQFAGLTQAPVFCPVVAPFPTGMEVTVPLFASQTNATKREIEAVYQSCYTNGVIRFAPQADEDGMLAANALSDTDRMEVSVFGNDARMVLVARFDNLGKGACGAAIQNMNLLLGADETAGLIV